MLPVQGDRTIDRGGVALGGPGAVDGPVRGDVRRLDPAVPLLDGEHRAEIRFGQRHVDRGGEPRVDVRAQRCLELGLAAGIARERVQPHVQEREHGVLPQHAGRAALCIALDRAAERIRGLVVDPQLG